MATKAAAKQTPKPAPTRQERAATTRLAAEKQLATDPNKVSKKARADILDRSKPYETCHPPGVWNGAFYAQEGRHYDIDGYRITGIEDEENEARLAAQKRASAMHRRSRREDDDPDFNALDAEAKDESAIEVVAEDEVNLTAWGRGDEEYRFAQVRKAIGTRFSRVVANEYEAVQFLIEEGVIAKGDARSTTKPSVRR